MSIATEITRLQTAKTDLKTSINAKTDSSHQITTETIDEYADFVDSISTGSTPLFTGHYDTEGLLAIGWTQAEIDYYNQNGVQWNSGSDNYFKLTTEEKSGTVSSTTRFLPKSSSLTSFANYYSLLAIPLIDTSSKTSFSNMFSQCNSLTTIPLIDTSSGTNFSEMFYECTSLTTIPQIDTSSGTNFSYMFDGCRSLTTIPLLNTSSGTNFSYMFENCFLLKTLSQINVSNCSNFTRMLYNCKALTTIPELDMSNCNNLNNMLYSCNSITILGGFKDLGEAYSTTQSANYSNYTLFLNYSTVITHDSLMNVINDLYDIATKGCNTQVLKLSSTSLALLTAEEIAIATNKGWTVS